MSLRSHTLRRTKALLASQRAPAVRAFSRQFSFFRAAPLSPVAASFSPRESSLTFRVMSTKAGVSSPQELKSFVDNAGNDLVVVDVRNPDSSVEPGDQKSLAVAALPSASHRPSAQHLIWNRTTASMTLPDVPLDTPIITHCGGGGRGQKAKDFLEKNGFTKVLNGGGPKEADCWAEFGDK